MKLIKRIKSYLYFSLNVDRLNAEFLQFVGMHVAYVLATSVTLVFVNTLLMRVSSDANITLKYSIIQFAFTGLSMLLAARLMHKFNNKVIIVIGISLSMLVYLMTFVFMIRLDTVYIIVAIIHGVASGFYWITYFNSLLIYSNDNTRDIAMSFLGIFVGIVSLIMPIISGLSIQSFAGFTGYYVVFGFCFIVAGIAVYLVLRLRVIEPIRKKSQFFALIKKVYTEPIWFSVLHTELFKGIREGAFGFFLNVILFDIVKSEGLVGFNTFLAGFVAMISSIVAVRIMRPHNRLKAMLVSTTVLTVLVSLLFFNLSAPTILILSVFNSFLSVFLVNPTTATLYSVLDRVKGAMAMKSEVFAVVECYKNAGRIIGVILILLLPKTSFFHVLSLMALTLTQFITILFLGITLKLLKKSSEVPND